jgi:multicomponent Na+:H+ antiporter subunit A
MAITKGPFGVSLPWAPGLDLSFSFHLDGLSALFATLVTGVGTLIVIYSAGYLAGHPHAGRFQVFLFAFMGAMLGVVLSDNLFALFVFWELTGFTSYLLIGFEHERQEARRAAAQALIVTGAGGLALLAAGILLVQTGGTADLSALRAAGSLRGDALYLAISSLVLAAAFTKSAQFPFHFWLPNAMQAPTPVSAYLHSATMVKGGVYLIARMTPLLGGTAAWVGTVVAVGAVTMVLGSFRAVLETDLKRVLAYSTIGALGVMVMLLGIGSPHAATAAIVYLFAHAFYKGALFLMSGAVEHETGTREVASLGGLRRAMPATALSGGLAALSMAGVPLLLGFVAKEQLYESVISHGLHDTWRSVMLVAAVAASACLGAAGFNAGIAPFAGDRRPSPAAHEAPPSLWIAPLALGLAGVVLGVVPGLGSVLVGGAAAAVTGETTQTRLVLWHGFTFPLLLSAVTLAVSVALYAYRERVRSMTWPRSLDTEFLYRGSVSVLDSLGRRVSPALQSASLRSYVLTVIATGVTLAGTALVAARILPAPRRWTPVHPHEALIAALIVAGAIAGVFARTNMAAVLSLGTVGYGVALMYGMLGAPDLAMTQFAVETLTVVIFVLVFYRLRGFGDLSSRAVRARDAAVALAAGVLVSTLVLSIGASGTASRLASYFVERAPTLGHGRNVVNVILVDFRALDTLGEVTVLVTVAVGVSALLLIGRERR